MYWTPLAVGLSTLAIVSGSQERAIGDVLAGAPGTLNAPPLVKYMRGGLCGDELIRSRRSNGLC